ncbi:ABC transporter ATP-binding protein [Faecalispora jeddahensis]|uniref:oligopeptide/dipeptide ABC transporter ATP-binding protein n=1 Tax=Faecalispora jeddahensis TaxID=1414721 RepID=UPI0027B9A88C|nr:ABC transporter ATP-binding protein [Faecalispora jeddahensis]
MSQKKEKPPVLEVTDLSICFRMYDRGLNQKELKVISSLNIAIHAGEILAVVGSSGSGKSLLAHAVLGILPHNSSYSGSMKYCGQELTPHLQKKLRGKEIALVPQSVGYLDPMMRVGKQVIGIHGTERQQQEVFRRFNLSPETAQKYPFQLSGGMARRVLVSTAVITDAHLIIADEPTPGLNLEVAEETMRYFREIADAGNAVMLITHDIDLALSIADKIAVFYAGTTIEIAPVQDFVAGKERLRHPYTKALWDALPQNDFVPISGLQPYAGSLPSGCPFAPRCQYRTDDCSGEVEMREMRGGEVRCKHAT